MIDAEEKNEETQFKDLKKKLIKKATGLMTEKEWQLNVEKEKVEKDKKTRTAEKRGKN